jgi:hypothetical protein
LKILGIYNDGVAIVYFRVRGIRQSWSVLRLTDYHRLYGRVGDITKYSGPSSYDRLDTKNFSFDLRPKS